MKRIIEEVFQAEEKVGAILSQARERAAELKRAAEKEASELMGDARQKAQETTQTIVEEAKKGASEIPGLLADPEPFVRFIPGFGDSSLDFTLICQVKEFVDQYLAQHELRKRIFRRFAEEGIEIPFPHRTVYLREEKEWKK